MRKKHFALIGHPLSHTLSPAIHDYIFSLYGIDAEYKILDIHPQSLKNHVKTLNALDGYNVTIPYKQKIIPYVDQLSDKARLYGSVNTIKNDGTSTGYTTDSYGFLSAIDSAGMSLKGNVLILGYGGAARIAAYESAVAECYITIAAREKSLHAASLLCSEIKNKFKNATISSCCLNNINGHFDILINATPVGMHPHVFDCPVSKDVVKRCENVFDMIYNPSPTLLIKNALSCGCNVSGGLEMLIYQAAHSEMIWNKTNITQEQINEIKSYLNSQL